MTKNKNKNKSFANKSKDMNGSREKKEKNIKSVDNKLNIDELSSDENLGSKRNSEEINSSPQFSEEDKNEEEIRENQKKEVVIDYGSYWFNLSILLFSFSFYTFYKENIEAFLLIISYWVIALISRNLFNRKNDLLASLIALPINFICWYIYKMFIGSNKKQQII
jgi:hypothetical protein